MLQYYSIAILQHYYSIKVTKANIENCVQLPILDWWPLKNLLYPPFNQGYSFGASFRVGCVPRNPFEEEKGFTLHCITRSSSACHVGPLALKRVIIFASIIWVYPFKHIWTHLKQFWTNLNPFEHIWSHLIIFEQVLNKFEHVWTCLNILGQSRGR